MTPKKKLFLLEWRLASSRVWLTWLVLWAVAGVVLLKAAFMSGMLLGHMNLPWSWFLLWLIPFVPGGVKYRLSECGGRLEHRVLWFGSTVCCMHSSLPEGVWSVDCIAGRYRLNRLLPNGEIRHFLWRTAEIPLFLVPTGTNSSQELHP